MAKRIILGCLLLVLAGVLPAQKRNAADTLYLATYTYSTNTRLANLQPLAGYLSAKTGYKVVAVSYPDVPELIEAIVHGRVDIAMMNTSGYLTLQRENPNKAIPLVNLQIGNDTISNYGGCLVAAKSTGINSREALKNHAQKMTLSLVNKSSTSGNLVPRLILNNIGIAAAENHFNVYYAGTHKKALEDVLTGKAQLGGCGCAEIDSAKATNDFDEKAVVIGSYNNIPLGPVVRKPAMDPQLAESICTLLLRVNETNEPVFRKFCEGWTEFKQATSFKKVSARDYDDFRKMFGNNESLWQMIR